MARAAEVFREQGTVSLLSKVLGETVFRRATLVERSVDEPDRPFEVDLPVEVRPLGPDDIDAYRGLRTDTPESEIRRRLQAGSLCVSVWHHERLVSATWVTFGRAWIEYLSRWLDLAPDEAFEHENYTLPEMRGRNLSPARFATLRSLLLRSARTRIIGVIMPGNRAAYRTQSKVGYRPIGTLGWIGIGPWRRHFIRLRPGARRPGSPAASDHGPR